MLENSYTQMFRQYNNLVRINQNVNIIETHVATAEAMKNAVGALKDKTKVLCFI